MRDIEVAVVIVTFKVAILTVACLRSLESERAAPGLRIHVIVVDNASGDAPQIAAAIAANNWESWVTLLTTPRNGGFAYGNNFAIRHAYEKGAPDYFHFLNPDTLVRDGAIGALVEFMEKERRSGIAGSCFEDVDGVVMPFAFRFPTLLSEIESGMQLGLVTWMLGRWVVRRRMGTNNEQVGWGSGASMMIRRTLLDDIGVMDEQFFLYFEETDFSIRAKRAGFSTWYVPASRVMHDAGQSTKMIHGKRETQRLPVYWFESRRRWFTKAYGVPYAIATDVCAVTAHLIGSLKNKILGRDPGVPFYIRDLIRHSALWRRNRKRTQA